MEEVERRLERGGRGGRPRMSGGGGGGSRRGKEEAGKRNGQEREGVGGDRCM